MDNRKSIETYKKNKTEKRYNHFICGTIMRNIISTCLGMLSLLAALSQAEYNNTVTQISSQENSASIRGDMLVVGISFASFVGVCLLCFCGSVLKIVCQSRNNTHRERLYNRSANHQNRDFGQQLERTSYSEEYTEIPMVDMQPPPYRLAITPPPPYTESAENYTTIESPSNDLPPPYSETE